MLETYMYICKNCKGIFIFTKSDWYRDSGKCTKCGGQLTKVEDIDDISELVSEEVVEI